MQFVVRFGLRVVVLFVAANRSFAKAVDGNIELVEGADCMGSFSPPDVFIDGEQHMFQDTSKSTFFLAATYNFIAYDLKVFVSNNSDELGQCSTAESIQRMIVMLQNYNSPIVTVNNLLHFEEVLAISKAYNEQLGAVVNKVSEK